MQIKIDQIVIEQVSKAKFLGVIINENLKWNDQLKTVTSKISKNIGIILKIRRNVPAENLIILYHTLIQPYLYYCNIIWGSDCTTFLENLFRKQKNAITTQNGIFIPNPALGK